MEFIEPVSIFFALICNEIWKGVSFVSFWCYNRHLNSSNKNLYGDQEMAIKANWANICISWAVLMIIVQQRQQTFQLMSQLQPAIAWAHYNKSHLMLLLASDLCGRGHHACLLNTCYDFINTFTG